MKRSHLIVGGCGFIGRHVARLLARAGEKVILADRRPLPMPFPPDVVSEISWLPLELTSADWDSLVVKADVIHHYAWTSVPASANDDPTGDLIRNVNATLGLLEALRRRGGGRVVFSSSGGTVYGKLQSVPVDEDHPLRPITGYGAGKVTAEVYFGLYRALHGLDCRIARIANPYGAGQNFARGQGAATAFLHHALNHKPIVIWGDGSVVRDYIHVEDVAKAMVALSIAPLADHFYTFNIGSGLGLSLNDIVAELELQLGRSLDVRYEASRPFDVPVSILDVTRAREVLDWRAEISFRTGIERTMADLAYNASFSSTDAESFLALRTQGTS